MRRIAPIAMALAPALALAACSHSGSAERAAINPSGDPLADAAAWLAAAERGRNARERAPYIERLDALRVAAAEGSSDDPLSGWRRQHDAGNAVPFRGRTLGPAYRRARVSPGESIRIEQIFYAGESAEIAAEANGADDVALKVSNPRAEAVCDKRLSPRANCRWLPIFTERFSIELENHGAQDASVYLVFR